MDKVKVLIADDHPTFREGLSRLLQEQPDLHVVATAKNGEEAIKLAGELAPDVIVLDVVMNGINGIETARQIKSHMPETSVLMISAYDYQSYATASMQAGASGYILKFAPVEEVVSAIRLVHAGGAVFDRQILPKVMGDVVDSTAAADKKTENKGLKKREKDILHLAAKGMSNRAIAERLGISERTVQSHMVKIFRRLGVNSRIGAVLRALEEGWITPNSAP